ncbi:Proteasome assembly chaperone 4 [Holothuria leucospilota]|uniref:Proteasome assembly chaperone 4 n=1 Tax=Holothuria leucospilota TaxID=206669 RepID=A0A9Q1HED7_HOLLE|nr:Proteasome assembly chaperone 4 [Holothuria leucospilota]
MATTGQANSVDCQLQVNNFTETLLDHKVFFQVLKMKDSFFIWVGSESPKLAGLAVAMTTNVDKEPSSASMIGENVDLLSASLAKKLAKATKKQVFVSYNFPSDHQLLSLVEKRLNEEMQIHPEWF